MSSLISKLKDKVSHEAAHHSHGATPSHGVAGVAPLGANYNESLTWLHHDELRRVGANWVRGFVDMHQTDNIPPDHDHPNVTALLNAQKAGFKVILSLKWNYLEHDFPRFGGPDLGAEAELRRLHHLLPMVMGKVDILVIGNEPFIECKGDGDDRLNNFYEYLADEVIEFRKSRGLTSTRLFMGALNRLDLPKNRTQAANRMLDFIKSRPDLEGVDLHLHIPSFDGHKVMLDYALSRIRPDQNFLITEFSLVWHWRQHFNDVVSSHYRGKHGLPPDTTVREVINEAIKNPMPYPQWEDFLTHEPWYFSRRNFMTNAMKLYRSTGRLVVATYGLCPMRERKQPFPKDGTPWILNSVLAPPMVQRNPDGSRHDNYPWAEEFRRLQAECQ
ncbi:hypothetical protein FQN54_004845 [Arachnomyces sp. PD_36]|nr:hypothetical protein FQN54_004845 [Arachnomyces sp. PD_36]